MAQKYWKLEKKGELSAAEVAAAVGDTGHTVLRTDVVKGKTTIYFAGDAGDKNAKALRSAAAEVKLADITK